MNIGIISSGNDSLALFKMLTKHDHQYFIVHDQTHFPFGSKDTAFVAQEIKNHLQFLKTQGVEKVILDPVYELLLREDSDENMKEMLLPLFQKYLEHAFQYSLVGKIWILTDFASKDLVQSLVGKQAEKHQLTTHQQGIKKFHFPFAYRVRAASARTAGIADLGAHNPYLIRTLKNDLRFFKDASVDTILPMHYQYFRMQRTIKTFFRSGKFRFWDLSVLEKCFMALVNKESGKWAEGGKWEYAVRIRTNQSPEFLLKEKELVRLLQRGKGVELQINRL